MKHVILHRILPVLIPLIVLIVLRCFIPESCENSTDVYWHIHAADRSFSDMIAKKYPITLSIWRDYFADKELLFHVLLKGYTGIKHLLHSPLTPPFTGASFLLLFLFLSAFVFAAARAGISDKMIWLCSIGTALFTPLFSYRLLMIRPHVLSMAMMMISCGFLFRGPGKWKTVLLIFGMGWLFAWAYSTPHLLLVTTIGFGIAYFPKEKYRAFLPVAAAAVGIFCGLLIHPQSPNTFTLWKIQGIDALLTPTAGLGDGLIPIAQELHPPKTHWLVMALPISFLLYFCLMMWNRLREQKGWKEIPPECTACMLLAVLWMGAAYMISLRPIEYAIPMLFLALGTLVPQVICHKSFRFSSKPGIFVNTLAVYIIIGAILTSCYTIRTHSRKTQPVPAQLAAALRKVAKPGDRIVNIDWSDFPPLVFLTPEFEYTWGLDPMFSFTPFPGPSKLLGKLSKPQVHSSWQIKKVFKADYAVLLRRQGYLAMNLISNSGWEVAYEGPDGWIFRLAATGGSYSPRNSFRDNGSKVRFIPARF